MVDYFFSEYDVAQRGSLRGVSLSFDDLSALVDLKLDLESDAEHAAAGHEVDAPAPSVEAVAALPRFDPESWVLVCDDPEWTPDDPDSLGNGFASPEAVRRWVGAMDALDAFVPDDTREAWTRVLAVLRDLSARGLGLHCSTDD